jgi:hypothetical protein
MHTIHARDMFMERARRANRAVELNSCFKTRDSAALVSLYLSRERQLSSLVKHTMKRDSHTEYLNLPILYVPAMCQEELRRNSIVSSFVYIVCKV